MKHKLYRLTRLSESVGFQKAVAPARERQVRMRGTDFRPDFLQTKTMVPRKIPYGTKLEHRPSSFASRWNQGRS